MKKNDWAVLTATIAYSILFYHQHAGVNFLIFSLILNIALGVLNPEAVKKGKWIFFSLCSLLTAAMVFVIDSSLSVSAFVISHFVLAGISVNRESSVLFNLFYTIYSIGGSIVFLILNLVNSNSGSEHSARKKYSSYLTWVIPVILILLFFFIYRSANPLFEKYTEKINLDSISGEWILFSLGGFLLTYGFIRHQRIKAIDNWERGMPNSISNDNLPAPKWNEKGAATILFVSLNIMLVFINALDIGYLYLGGGLPEGISHKTFVHNGVGMLILSIILAISILIYFFRGKLNFSEKNQFVKMMVYCWIIQNLFMVVSTMIRNNMYVHDYLLTYKRIGVYVWLLLACAGLITTFIKVAQRKTNWFLFKSNSFIAFVLLIFSSCVDWDGVITNYNISHMKNVAQLDKRYLISLSETNLPQLVALKEEKDFNTDSIFHYSAITRSWDYSERENANSSEVDMKLYNYLKYVQNEDWRSFSIRNKRIIQELKSMDHDEKIARLNFSGKYLNTLAPLANITNVKDINCSNCNLQSLKELKAFPKLETLDLSSNHLSSLDSLGVVPSLTKVDLSHNSISDLKKLDQMQNLSYLSLSGNRLSSLYSLPKLKELDTLDLSDNMISDYNPLSRVSGISALILNHSTVAIERFPQLSNLKSIEMKLSANIAQRSLKYLRAPQLENLDLSANELKNLNEIVDFNTFNNRFSTKFPELRELDLSGNEVVQLAGLGILNKLERLDLSSNQIKDANELKLLKNLKSLKLGGNLINSLDFLEELSALNELSIDRNTYLTDFSAICKLNKLKSLNVSGTSFNSLKPISGMEMKELNLSNCIVSDLSELTRFTKLETLYVSSLKPTDFSTLAKLKTLKRIVISLSDEKLVDQLRKSLPNTTIDNMGNYNQTS